MLHPILLARTVGHSRLIGPSGNVKWVIGDKEVGCGISPRMVSAALAAGAAENFARLKFHHQASAQL